MISKKKGVSMGTRDASGVLGGYEVFDSYDSMYLSFQFFLKIKTIYITIKFHLHK